MRNLVMVILSSGLLVGCATSVERFPTADLERSKQVEFMQPYELSRTDVEFVDLGVVRGESCQRPLLDGQASQEEAMIAMKLAAADKQANRIVLKRCQQDSDGGCTARWWCEGTAFQAQPLQ
ncbi:Rcs stress response system protein RcsF [Pseudidiomarina homiensis]|uniref:Uncharacterized protein n=1 Tax=Pseudidiomarina homiensis TaxID=364198 RepID=A0A432XUE9_9GAMM|nr:Rcs stress response system protein RcsF [Pseudidiomarina homiensis]RUO52352.1 hypothetical protein CWI70_11540 [Pseudidiomarina homiensis]